MSALADLVVWDDETGERFYVAGHVNRRRALAAVSHYVRESSGLEDRRDQLGDVRVADVSVAHLWTHPAPQFPGDDETHAWCGPEQHDAEPVTQVSL